MSDIAQDARQPTPHKRKRRPLPQPSTGPTIYVAMVHGIGAAKREIWAEKSVDVLANWWLTVQRGVRASELPCPNACEMALGHRHLWLVCDHRSARVDLEPLFWADSVVDRPGRWRCAKLVLKAGLLIGLVDLLAAGVETFERLDGGMDSYRAMSLTCWRFISLFTRPVIFSVLVPLLIFLILVSERARATVGDALQWSMDPVSHERVSAAVATSLERSAGEAAVLIGHSQGGSILAELEPLIRRPGRDVRLVTLGSGHSLLMAVQKVLPGWGIWRSLLAWAAVLAYATLAIVSVGALLLTLLPSVGLAASHGLKIGAAIWLMHDVPDALTHSMMDPATLTSSIPSQLLQPLPLPQHFLPVEIAGTIVGLLIVTFAVKPARLLRGTLDTEALGVDIVASHDVVAAAMLQLGSATRLRRVNQCGSLVLDHITYMDNGCAVLPLLAAEVESIAHMDQDSDDSVEAIETFHRSGLTLRMWTRPVLMLAIASGIAWFASGHSPTAIWVAAIVICCLGASLAMTRSSRKWLKASTGVVLADPQSALDIEQVRHARASRWWAGMLLVASLPLISGAAIVFTTPRVLSEASKHGDLRALTIVAFIVGIALSWVAWLALFGAEWSDFLTIGVLVCAAIVWFFQGTRWGLEMGAFVLVLALWGYRRATRYGRGLPRERGAPSSVEA
jgi:hypothetical protein